MPNTWDQGQNFTQYQARIFSFAASRHDEIEDFYGASPATGRITFAANPANADTITIGTTAVHFVTAPTSGSVTIGPDLQTTLTNLVAFLNASADAQLVKARYSASDTTLYLRDVSDDASGDTLALASSSANGVASGATLSGGQATAPSGLPRYPTWAAAINASIAAIPAAVSN